MSGKRQLKLGAVTMGAGGPGQPYLWLDAGIPADASVNIGWYIEQARLAEAAKCAGRAWPQLDGLNYHVGHPARWRRFLSEVVPILQEREIVRSEYSSATLRGNLGLPVPENRYTRARRERAAAPARVPDPAPAGA